MKTACTWPWKPASSQECVTAHMPNGLVPKMDGSYRGRARYGQAAQKVGAPGSGGAGGSLKGGGDPRPEGLPVPILVSVGAFKGRP